jgi:acyl-CoA thioester hydrolase
MSHGAEELAMSTSALDGVIRDGRHLQLVRVYYEDTDFSGIVYHASYLRFMERGRTNYLRLLGADQRALFEEAEKEAPGFAFVVRAMTLDFLKPARMDDILRVTTAPAEVKGASIALHQTVTRGEELLVEARVRVAFVSGGRARPIPKALRVAMRADPPSAGGADPPLRVTKP